MRIYQKKARQQVDLTRLVWALMLVLMSTASRASDFVYPDTPLGRMYERWFEAHAVADENALRSFLITNMYGEDDPDLDSAVFMGMMVINDTGGITPHSILKTGEFEGTMLARGNNGQWLRIVLRVEHGPPHQLVSEGVRTSDGPEAEAAAVSKLTPETRREVVESVAKLLREQYVYADAGVRYSDAILDELASGTFDKSSDGLSLAAKLTGQLQQIQKDQHLRVLDPSRAEVFRRRYKGDHEEPGAAVDGGKALKPKTGFDSASVLENHLGYIRMSSFNTSPDANARVEEIMRSMQDVDTLVFDLRTNSGGDGDMVLKLQSYLFEEPTLVGTSFRRGGSMEYRGETQHWTTPNDQSSKFANIPVYILVGNYTASAAEAFTSGLKRSGRAVVIGETTAGAGHMVELQELPAGFAITLPIGGPKDPRDDLEGTGIQPDIPMPAGTDLEEVLKIIRTHSAK